MITIKVFGYDKHTINYTVKCMSQRYDISRPFNSDFTQIVERMGGTLILTDKYKGEIYVELLGPNNFNLYVPSNIHMQNLYVKNWKLAEAIAFLAYDLNYCADERKFKKNPFYMPILCQKNDNTSYFVKTLFMPNDLFVRLCKKFKTKNGFKIDKIANYFNIADKNQVKKHIEELCVDVLVEA